MVLSFFKNVTISEWAGLTCIVSTKSKLQIANVSLIWTAFYKPGSDSTYCRLTVVDIVQSIGTYTQFSEGKLFNFIFSPCLATILQASEKGKLHDSICFYFPFLCYMPMGIICKVSSLNILHLYIYIY